MALNKSAHCAFVYALAIGGALASTFAFAPFSISAAMPICLLPLLVICRIQGPVGAAIGAYLFFVVEILTTSRWVYVGAASMLGSEYYALAVIAAVAKALPYAIACGLAAVLSRWFPSAWPFLIALGITGAEIVSSSGDRAFGFALISLSQVSSPLSSVLAPMFGAHALAFAIVFAAAIATDALLRRTPCRVENAAISVVVFVLACTPVISPSEEPSRDIALIEQGRVTNTLAEELTHAPVGALVIWPEDSAIYHDSSEQSLLFAMFHGLATRYGVTLVAGMAGTDGTRTADQAVIATMRGNVTIYTKRRLIPFAETIPYRRILERLFPILRDIRDMSQGDDTVEVFEPSRGDRIRPLLCYEAIFSEFYRALGPRTVVAVLTDDGWFRGAAGPLQQVDALRLRAIESGAAIVVSGTTGPSGTIDAHGVFRRALPVGLSGAQPMRVPFTHPTLYSALGDAPFAVLLGLIGAVYIFSSANLLRRVMTARIDDTVTQK